MLDNLNTKQKRIIGLVGIVLLIFVSIFYYNKTNDNDTINVDESMLIANNSTEEDNKEKENEDIIVVHITGAVKMPGVVKLPEGSRMEDAIEKARRINRRQ